MTLGVERLLERRTDGKILSETADVAPLRVSVLVNLFKNQSSGGHVKAWERFAQAATHQPRVDLTVHYLGEEEKILPISDNVRFRLHRPRLSTLRFPFMSAIPDHTDLASYNPSLAKALVGRDVIHTTDAFFAFAGTAEKVARRERIPLVNSVHTDTPSYTRVYTAQIVERMFGKGLISRALLNGLRMHLRAEQRMLRRLDHHQRASSFVWVSKPEDYEALCKTREPSHVGFLRRGVDKSHFNPAKRDRAWLEQRFSLRSDQVIALFVGRLSQGKNVMIVAEAIAKLAAEGQPIHLLCAGQGPLQQAICEKVGKNGCCAGIINGDELARLYASVDLLAMPSEIEIFSNVVQEAVASGLPTVLARRGGMGRLIAPEETGIIVEERTPEGWAKAMRTLCHDPQRRANMGRAARAYAETKLPSWEDVLNQDLMPFWLAAAAQKKTAAAV
ncbi:MAG TPA: glycosyltransferase [Planctomycetota bacterium]|jgi:glycosyltransferase involved in cell wall biosynthesis